MLELVDGAWAPAGEHATFNASPPGGTSWTLAPAPVPPPTGESDASDFEAQIEAWRRRR